MKKMLDKQNLIKILLILTLIGCGTTKTNQKEKDELLIGIWTIESSTFNDRGSPVPKNTSLEFKTDKKVKVTLPKFGENNEDVSGFGTWNYSEGFVKIKWNDEKLWGKPQNWKILELNKSKLHWKFEMISGIQEEKYKRKK